MSIKAVLFDLDGTLLPMDQDVFVKTYFKLLAMELAPFGYEPEELVENIWAGTAAMVMNNGSCKNEDAFWSVFTEKYGPESIKDKEVIDGFYSGAFAQVQSVCGYTPEAKEVVELAKGNGRIVVLATNPIFPAVATRARMGWAGVTPEDFALYTTYENCCNCKPNSQYYLDIAERIGCKPEECLMIGNDVVEDMIAETVGMKVFLLKDCIINKNGQDISGYPQGGFKELKEYLQNLA
jgi:FMN phosphatase YigB (HAD superfamily)